MWGRGHVLGYRDAALQKTLHANVRVSADGEPEGAGGCRLVGVARDEDDLL